MTSRGVARCVSQSRRSGGAMPPAMCRGSIGRCAVPRGGSAGGRIWLLGPAGKELGATTFPWALVGARRAS
jgi:hypothetical protein